jgi:hypothetical protein
MAIASFGSLTFTTSPINNNNIIGSIYSSDDQITEFEAMCKTLLSDDYSTVSIPIFHNTLFHLMNETPTLVHDTLYKILDTETVEFHDWILESLVTNIFTLNSFIAKYQHFTVRTNRLSNFLQYYEENSVRGLSQKSSVSLIRNYLFYSNVVAAKYTDELMNLYEVFNKILITEKVEIQSVLSLFKMKHFYKTLCYNMFTNISAYENINKDFLTNLGSNQEFVRNMVTSIHNKLKMSKQSPPTDDDIKSINELVHLSTTFSERDIFNIYYQKFFEERLLAGQLDVSTERDIIKEFKVPDDNKFIQSLSYKLDDVIESGNIYKGYLDLKISVKSEKYVGLNVSELQRNMFHCTLMRHGAWENSSTDYIEYTIPMDIAPYVDIYTAYYKIKYAHRKLYWNFNLGTCIYEIDFGNDNKYEFKVTIPQLFVLLQFNKKEKITATELAQNMGITVKILGPILNSLIRARILNRESGANNNQNLCFYYNKDFTHPTRRINVATLMNAITKPTAATTHAQVEEQFKIGRNNLLCARIVKMLKQHKSLNVADLKTLAEKDMPFKFDDSFYTACLESCVKDSYIKKVHDTYEYVEEIESSDEDTEDSDDDI